MKLKKLLYCLLSSLLLWFSFPQWNAAWCAFIAFVPFFFGLETTSKRQAFLFSYISGFLFFLLTLLWLRHVTFLGLIILCLYLACYFAIFGFFVAGITKKKPIQNLTTIIFLSSLWAVSEYIRGHFLTGFAWAFLGHSQYRNIAFIQFADSIGAAGVSFVVMFINICVYAALKSFLQKKYPAVKRIAVIAALLVVVIYSYGIYSLQKFSAQDKKSPVFRVALVQGNIFQQEKLARIFRSRIKTIYASLSQEAVVYDPDLVIWPETSYPDYIIAGDEGRFKEMKGIVDEVRRPILFGAVLGECDYYFNAAFLLSPFDDSVQEYRKIHLVPFGEYIPLRNHLPFCVLHFLEQIVPIEDFNSGNEFSLFQLSNQKGQFIKYGVLICFEDTVAELSRQFRLRGADFLVNITNDAWFERSASPYQHVQASVFRAIENRAYVVRAANTGISCFINKAGKIVQRVQDARGNQIFVRGVLHAEVRKGNRFSLYTRYGDWFILLCAIYALVFIICLRKEV